MFSIPANWLYIGAVVAGAGVLYWLTRKPAAPNPVQSYPGDLPGFGGPPVIDARATFSNLPDFIAQQKIGTAAYAPWVMPNPIRAQSGAMLTPQTVVRTQTQWGPAPNFSPPWSTRGGSQ